MQIVSKGDNLHEYQILFSGKSKKNITNMSSAEFAKRMANVKSQSNMNINHKRVTLDTSLSSLYILINAFNNRFLSNADMRNFFFFFFFFFDLDFTVLSRIFHLYGADRSSKVGENRRTWGKPPDHP